MNQIEFYMAKLRYEIDSWDLSEAMKSNDGVVVVDTCSTNAYEIEHIPSAINIPHKAMSAETTKDFDKSIIYVTYCDGVGCNASTRGAVNLARLGFQVKELLGGLDWWKRDGYATDGKYGAGDTMVSCSC